MIPVSYTKQKAKPRDKQSKLPKKPRFEPKQNVPKGIFPVKFQKASELK